MSSFTGRVRSLSPTLSKDRRTLRIFFQVSDPEGRLKPGMFAEIGLGTDVRKSLMIPADGVLHVGQSDYVIQAGPEGLWKIAEVKTGEQSGDRIEVLQGLKSGDRVVGSGAILLKPYVVRDIQGVGKAVGWDQRTGTMYPWSASAGPPMSRMIRSQRWAGARCAILSHATIAPQGAPAHDSRPDPPGPRANAGWS